jgi:CAF1 family ribonuclease
MILSSKKTFIQIVENKEKTHETIKIARKQKFESRINEAIGLRKVLEMIIESHCVVVGHNLFQDLVFIWSQFLAELPDTLESFCNLVSETFPVYSSHAIRLIIVFMIRSIYLLCIRFVVRWQCQNLPRSFRFREHVSKISFFGRVNLNLTLN